MSDVDKVDFFVLQTRLARLEYRVKMMSVGAAIAMAALVLAGWEQTHQRDVITAKRLAIVDERGAQRVILGAPLPDPVIAGKPQHRRSAFNGILLSNSNGDEIGGWGSLDDRTELSCFDQSGRERVCLYVLPNARSGLLLQDPQGKERVGIHVEAGGKAELQFLNAEEKPVLTIPDDKIKPVRSVARRLSTRSPSIRSSPPSPRA